MTRPLNIREARDWDLFEDWCRSTADLAQIDVPAIDLFLVQLPASPAIHRQRVRAIRRGLTLHGVLADLPEPAQSSTIRVGEGWAGIPRALAQLPVTRFPVGLRGRRDGWLLVLIGVLGMSRRQALAITPDDVVLFPQLTVAGRPVPTAPESEGCPACAVHRWLQVAGPAMQGFRSEVIELVDPAACLDAEHDCWTGLDGQWRNAAFLAPAVDRYGWVVGAGRLSAGAVSAIMRYRQVPRDMPRKFVPRPRSDATLDRETSAQLAAAYDDMDARVDALFARTAEVLGDSSDLLDHLNGFGLTPED